ncbi:MAG: lytic transglycosylase domain-containing protein [Alphaproteobacteria bacterium]|nr:lytic transglycosylase domain-containing protein [Alphaproteobacteria bacterium]
MAKYDSLIEDIAKKRDGDPDLIRAVMWSENARGHFFGMNDLADSYGFSNTVMPMNVNKKLWSGLVGASADDINNPRKNIEAGAELLKRIQARMDDPKDIAKIGTIWNGASLTKTNDFGETIGRVYREKPWRR